MANLQIAVKAEYFDQIKSGEKTEEYRLVNAYWSKRLIDRSYDDLALTCGYPSSDDKSRYHRIPDCGYWIKTITHPHFGPAPVEVFALQLTPYGRSK